MDVKLALSQGVTDLEAFSFRGFTARLEKWTELSAIE